MPESEDQIVIAQEKIDEARSLLADGYSRIAMREAYMAGLAAVRAMIFELTLNSPKTHSGARAMYNKLVRDYPDLDLPSAAFMQAGFDAKQEIDYGGQAQSKLSPIQAIEAAEAYLSAARRIIKART